MAMNAAPELRRPRSTRWRHVTLACRVAAGLTLIVLAACGAPAHVATLDGEPDLAGIAARTIPHGWTSQANAELRRLLGTCEAIDAKVATVLPDLTAGRDATGLALLDGQCEW